MITEYNRKGWALVVFGILLFIGCLLLAIALPNFVLAYTQVHHGLQPQWILYMKWFTPQRLGHVGPIAIILFIIGVVYLAKGKGYNVIFGLFFGFLLFIGLLIVLVLPDRTKN